MTVFTDLAQVLDCNDQIPQGVLVLQHLLHCVGGLKIIIVATGNVDAGFYEWPLIAERNPAGDVRKSGTAALPCQFIILRHDISIFKSATNELWRGVRHALSFCEPARYAAFTSAHPSVTLLIL